MADDLNEYFSSAFTKEDISSLPLPARIFEEDESNNVGQLFVTPEMISKQIKMMKENKSPGVDGIPLELLKKIVNEISIPLANFLFYHLKRELFQQNGRKQMLHHYLKRDRGVRQTILDQ